MSLFPHSYTLEEGVSFAPLTPTDEEDVIARIRDGRFVTTVVGGVAIGLTISDETDTLEALANNTDLLAEAEEQRFARSEALDRIGEAITLLSNERDELEGILSTEIINDFGAILSKLEDAENALGDAS